MQIIFGRVECDVCFEKHRLRCASGRLHLCDWSRWFGQSKQQCFPDKRHPRFCLVRARWCTPSSVKLRFPSGKSDCTVLSVTFLKNPVSFSHSHWLVSYKLFQGSTPPRSRTTFSSAKISTLVCFNESFMQPLWKQFVHRFALIQICTSPCLGLRSAARWNANQSG